MHVLFKFTQRKNNTKFRTVAHSERGQQRSGGTPRTFTGVINDGLIDSVGRGSHNGENNIIS